jgi:hypothetical protein
MDVSKLSNTHQPCTQSTPTKSSFSTVNLLEIFTNDNSHKYEIGGISYEIVKGELTANNEANFTIKAEIGQQLIAQKFLSIPPEKITNFIKAPIGSNEYKDYSCKFYFNDKLVREIQLYNSPLGGPLVSKIIVTPLSIKEHIEGSGTEKESEAPYLGFQPQINFNTFRPDHPFCFVPTAPIDISYKAENKWKIEFFGVDPFTFLIIIFIKNNAFEKIIEFTEKIGVKVNITNQEKEEIEKENNPEVLFNKKLESKIIITDNIAETHYPSIENFPPLRHIQYFKENKWEEDYYINEKGCNDAEVGDFLNMLIRKMVESLPED